MRQVNQCEACYTLHACMPCMPNGRHACHANAVSFFICSAAVCGPAECVACLVTADNECDAMRLDQDWQEADAPLVNIDWFALASRLP